MQIGEVVVEIPPAMEISCGIWRYRGGCATRANNFPIGAWLPRIATFESGIPRPLLLDDGRLSLMSRARILNPRIARFHGATPRATIRRRRSLAQFHLARLDQSESASVCRALDVYIAQNLTRILLFGSEATEGWEFIIDTLYVCSRISFV